MLNKQKLRTFVLGGVAGALAGILFAPKSGKELRGSIASRAGEARERSRESYFEAQERVQERISEARERPPRQEEARPVTDLRPRLEPAAAEPALGPEPPIDSPAMTPPDPPPLRDVSRDAPWPAAGDDPEELRRRIQETRSRLRGRLEAPGPERPDDAPGDHDV